MMCQGFLSSLAICFIIVACNMRLILENYFKILGGISEDNIVDKFSVPEKREICRSLMLWIYDRSH